MGYGLAQLFILLFLKFFEMWNTEKPTKKGASLRSASRFARLPASLAHLGFFRRVPSPLHGTSHRILSKPPPGSCRSGKV